MPRFVIVVLLAIPLGFARAQTTAHSLPNEIDDVRWNVSSTVFGDFACRGKQDMALFGESKKSGFVVMVQLARKGVKPKYLFFAARGRDPKGLRLTVESLDFSEDVEFKQEISATAPGLQPSKSCRGLALGDDETDANHIYWNRKEKVFQSWSL